MGRGFKPRREHFKDLLSLHTGERRGFLVLCAILLLLSCIAAYLKFWYRPPPADLASLHAEMEAWVAIRNSQAMADTVPQGELFPFDPNTIEREAWMRLGLSSRQVDGIDRYKAKGGRFRVKKDLGRMYSIRPEQYDRMAPFILLPDSFPRRSHPARVPKQWETDRTRSNVPAPAGPAIEPKARVELNSADTTALIGLRGIGPAFARGIVKYRTMLGGYTSLEQLSEVYILRDKPDAVERIKAMIDLDPSMIDRIPINTCTVEALAAHPYARWHLAKPLVAYRQQHGPFKTLEEIKGCRVITDSIYLRLVPYLSLE
ncbi:MAG: helix-hairpin-helix domain-containing protein [Flavobacteriales bacterium]|nr:helix-hairpin-helix domain-containing protein [Flavobacteriales bacterium]